MWRVSRRPISWRDTTHVHVYCLSNWTILRRWASQLLNLRWKLSHEHQRYRCIVVHSMSGRQGTSGDSVRMQRVSTRYCVERRCMRDMWRRYRSQLGDGRDCMRAMSERQRPSIKRFNMRRLWRRVVFRARCLRDMRRRYSSQLGDGRNRMHQVSRSDTNRCWRSVYLPIRVLQRICVDS